MAQIVYLATYPRSGNAWTRQLIEEATGQATGSMFQGEYAKNYVFKGAHFMSDGTKTDPDRFGYELSRKLPDGVMVVKVHWPLWTNHRHPQHHHIKKIIRIVRNPIDSVGAFIQYDKKPYTDENAIEYAKKYNSFHVFWNTFKGDVMTIKYESLLTNTKTILDQILNFIGIDHTMEDIDRAILRYPPFGEYLKRWDNFTTPQILKITSISEFLNKKFNYDWSERLGLTHVDTVIKSPVEKSEKPETPETEQKSETEPERGQVRHLTKEELSKMIQNIKI